VPSLSKHVERDTVPIVVTTTDKRLGGLAQKKTA